MKNPYEIVKRRRVTEKSRVLENLQYATSNKSLNRCKTPIVVFEVDLTANKSQIKRAVELIYAEKKVKVISVNTISIPSKRRRVRGHAGMTARLKKAVVTFRPGDAIDEKA
jgi:large subunit ribosomal protein L23